ncbi:hypothetical protein INR49_030164 [Caranx melampygus]|nr:hypothetical protein INR49_030164 [Caranx melampygus]
MRVNQLVEQIQDNGVVTRAIDTVISLIRGQQSTLAMLRQSQSELCQNEKRWESQFFALEAGYKKALAENEENWQKIMQDMERKYNMWHQKEEKWWRQKISTLEEEIKQMIKQSTQPQALAENEENWQKIMQDMERKYNMWHQKEEEWWRQKISTLEEEIKQLTEKSAQPQVLAENTENWQNIMQEMERKYNMWLQNEEEWWREKIRTLEEEIKQLIIQCAQPQGIPSKKKKKKPWWRRRFKLRRHRRGTLEETLLQPQPQEN